MSASNNSESSPSSSPAPSRASRFILAGIVLAIALALDLWTKQWAWDNLREQPAVEVISGLFYLKFGFNTGSAFSFLRDAEWARSFFIAVTFLALGYMGWLASQIPTRSRWGFISIGLIAAGAAGNLHDRFVRIDKVWINGHRELRYGVVDFLQFYYPWDPENYWPIFNVADMALVCGVGILLLHLRKQGKEALGAADEAPSLKNAEEAEGSAA